MKHLIVQIVFCSLFISCIGSRPDQTACDQLKEGFFAMTDPESGTEYLITRANDIQTEINQSTMDTSRYSVLWGDDCYYKLNLIEGPEWMQPLWAKNELTVKITKVKKNLYECRAKFSNSQTILNNTIRIIQ